MRTDEQTQIALFWRASPTAIWNPILRKALERAALSLPDTARAAALFYLAAADASVACWEAKYVLQLLAAAAGDRSTETSTATARPSAIPPGGRWCRRRRIRSTRPGTRPTAAAMATVLDRSSATSRASSSRPPARRTPASCGHWETFSEGARGGDRCAGVLRHPLPHGRRGRGASRAPGGAVRSEPRPPTRQEAVTRAGNGVESGGVTYRFARFSASSDTRQLLVEGREVHVSPKAFELLLMLIEHRSARSVEGRAPGTALAFDVRRRDQSASARRRDPARARRLGARFGVRADRPPLRLPLRGALSPKLPRSRVAQTGTARMYLTSGGSPVPARRRRDS